MRRVSTCKQDATIELLVWDKGEGWEAVQKSSSAAEAWRGQGSHGVLRRACQVLLLFTVILEFFSYHNIWKKCTTCRLCLAKPKRTHTRLRGGLFHLRMQSVWHEGGRRWSTNWDEDGPCDFDEASCDHRRQYDVEGEHAPNISRKWNVYNCNFQLFLFETPL